MCESQGLQLRITEPTFTSLRGERIRLGISFSYSVLMCPSGLGGRQWGVGLEGTEDPQRSPQKAGFQFSKFSKIFFLFVTKLLERVNYTHCLHLLPASPPFVFGANLQAALLNPLSFCRQSLWDVLSVPRTPSSPCVFRAHLPQRDSFLSGPLTGTALSISTDKAQ